ncbi:MAG TPA: prepilin peptidase [Candidatus Saccharimonadales bacterium]|nr:prepilin peptidase [Candidatus Saccharimonadales bacterium]
MPIFLGLVGLAMGSFAGALVWRIRTKRNFVHDRSECESCHHKLGPLDLIPVLSWVLLKGKCRYCKAPIAKVNSILEVTVGALFAFSYFFWPLGFNEWQAVASFCIWLLYIVLLAALFLYDLRWMLLPDKLVWPLVALGLCDGALRASLAGKDFLVYALLGIVVLAGSYGLLYAVSKGKWVGFGDVKLGIFMGAALGGPDSLLVLLLANVIGFLVVAPGLAMGKLTRKSRVPFGPFLIVAFFIAGLFGNAIIGWYLNGLILAAF